MAAAPAPAAAPAAAAGPLTDGAVDVSDLVAQDAAQYSEHCGAQYAAPSLGCPS
jgi:hypothetical protein